MESNILENSLIHLLDAVNRLDETIPDVISIKYAVVHLWSGIKLLLEAKLFETHWSLVYKSENHSDYPTGGFLQDGFAPIDFEDLKNRLDASCGIHLGEYAYVLDKIHKDYNDIEVSQFMGSKVQITSNLVEVWPFLVDFILKYVDFSHDTYSQNLFNQTCELMDSHLKFIRCKKKDISAVISNQLKESHCARPLKCPKCLQDAIPLLPNGNPKFRCAFCDNVIDWRQLAVECGSYSDYLGPFDCLDCASRGMLKTQDQWICLACCNGWTLAHIRICGSCRSRLVWAQSDKRDCIHCEHSAF